MAFTDQSTRVRDGEELDANLIDPYLKAHIPGLTGAPRISQFPGGASNLTYLLEYPEQEFVLRRPPFGHKAKSAHDMGREFRILNQLRDEFPYCPKAYVHCTDESVMGAEFYVMERVKGIILRSDLPPEQYLPLLGLAELEGGVALAVRAGAEEALEDEAGVGLGGDGGGGGRDIRGNVAPSAACGGTSPAPRGRINRPQLALNFSSLIASKSCTPPPTRFVV